MEIDEELKNRVAGAVVVTILAVIFLPMLFDDPEIETNQEISELEIPQNHISPALKTLVLPEDLDAVVDTSKNTNVNINVNKVESSVQKLIQPNSNTKIIPEDKIVPIEVVKSTKVTNKKIVPRKYKPKVVQHQVIPPRLNTPKNSAQQQAVRWFIQVASFIEQNNAIKLQNRLIQQGFTARVDSSWTKKGQVYRVKVGPELNRQRVEIMQSRINQLNNVKSIAVPE